MSKSVTKPGFTIVELLIVIVVIGILATLTIVAYNGIQDRAKDSAAISNAQQTGKKLTVYALSNGEVLPATLAEASITNSGDTTYQYTPNTTTTPNTFCLTVTAGSISAHIAGSTSSIKNAVPGPCPGHTGTSPTVAASGECPTGYIVVPGSSLYGTEAFCVMKYEAKIQGQANGNQTYNSSYVADSRPDGTPWVNISQTNAIAEAAALGSGYHLITEAEWLTIAQNVMSVPGNWSGDSVGSGYMYRGHTDGTPANALAASTDSDPYSGTGQTTAEQRRTLTLTNGEVIWDLAGNDWEWTQGITTGAGNQPAPAGGGYAWREWTTTNLLPGNFPNIFPGYMTGYHWNSTQGVGKLLSSNIEAGTRVFLRGGRWGSGADAGVLTLALDNSPSVAGVNLGFRVSR